MAKWKVDHSLKNDIETYVEQNYQRKKFQVLLRRSAQYAIGVYERSAEDAVF